METGKPRVRFHCFSNSVGVAASILSACQGFTQVLLIITSIWLLPSANYHSQGLTLGGLPPAHLLPGAGYCWGPGTCGLWLGPERSYEANMQKFYHVFQKQMEVAPLH